MHAIYTIGVRPIVSEAGLSLEEAFLSTPPKVKLDE